MAAHILQVAYYQSLLEIRTRMLESGGYEVTSALGNDEAFRLAATVIATVDRDRLLCFASYSDHGGSLFQATLFHHPGRRLAIPRL
jgi:hypothetical protein